MYACMYVCMYDGSTMARFSDSIPAVYVPGGAHDVGKKLVYFFQNSCLIYSNVFLFSQEYNQLLLP